MYITVTTIGTYQNKDDFIILMCNLDKTFVAYNFVLKVMVFSFKRKQLSELINEIRSSGDKVSDHIKRLMILHVVIITVGAAVVLGLFGLLALCKGEMVVEAWLPFDPHKNVMNSLLAMQMLFASFCVPILGRSMAMQGMVCSIAMYLCQQFINLQNRIKMLDYSPETETLMKMEFKEIIKKHIRLMRYSKLTSNIFEEYFFIQNIAVSVELCLNAIMATMVGYQQMTLFATFIGFLALALINAYIYSFLGNEMIIQSQAIAEAAYEAPWTSWPLYMQKDLLLFISVAQKPLSLTAAGVVTVSMKSYSQALYNGYSVFAVLNDLTD
ncbi:odorant receptor 49a-like [Battus philenor]|uniref:odorant receptor 49a-like n=1 Tax=Battus philenor TaxID=42288 RepID=UPI0035CEB5B9